MKNVNKFLFLFLSFYVSACENRNEEKYEVVDFKKNDVGNCLYTVFAADTTWEEMKSFAQNLIKDEGTYSAVGFFSPREKVPKINSNHSIPGDSGEYLIAIYRYDEQIKKFVLIKNPKRK